MVAIELDSSRSWCLVEVSLLELELGYCLNGRVCRRADGG